MFWGVKQAEGSAGKFSARVFHANSLRVRGMFDTALEAAVAFDYSQSYFKGGAGLMGLHSLLSVLA